MIAYEDYNKLRKRRGCFKNTTKEERAKQLGNIICPKCGYQNHWKWIKVSGRCNLCRITLDKDYFKNKLMRMCSKNGWF